MIIIFVGILVISVVLHEMAHAYAANWLGDPTARLQGRLSPNPFLHLDPLMSVILPALLVVTQLPLIQSGGTPLIFGAAKPVPYNPYNLVNQKWGEAIVAAAGPAMNIFLAGIFAILIRFADILTLPGSAIQLFEIIIVLNLFLAFFNLVPIPPLDGSKILPRFLPLTLRLKYDRFRLVMEQNILLAFSIVLITFVFVLGQPLVVLVRNIAALMAGY